MYCRSDHWSSISVSLIQPALRNTASSPIRGSCQPICRILSNSSGGSMIGECRWISTESLWRTSERLERRFRINPWVYFWKILKLLVAFRLWSLSKWDSSIGCLKDQKCETHAGSFLRAICTLFYLYKFQMPDFASARRFTNVKKQTFIIKPDNGCQARWKSDAFSRSCAGEESSRGCKDQEAPTQLRNVPAKPMVANLPTLQLTSVAPFLWCWLYLVVQDLQLQTFAGEGNLFDPWRGEGSGGFFLHLCSSEVRSDGAIIHQIHWFVWGGGKIVMIRPWNLMEVFFWYM